MTDQEMQNEIRRLERERQELVRKASDARAREARSREDAFIRREGIHTNCSDDYWTLTVGKHEPIYKDSVPLYDFYFGYERPYCPVHGADEKACDTCPESEWGFEAKVNGKSVLRLGASALAGTPSYDDGVELLLAGIAMFMRDHMTIIPNESNQKGAIK